MADPVRIVGSYLSPYVRKVLVCLGSKGIPYEIDPIVPFFGDERFSQASPLRRVPVLIDGRVTLSDSSVICQYLEELHPAAAFVFIGLDPNTGFVAESVDLDERGLIVTDMGLQTSMPGVFAAGDVRAGSTKQLASAVGEGAAAAIGIRMFLEAQDARPMHMMEAG